MDKWKKQKMDFIEGNNDISVNVADAITLVARIVILIILSGKLLNIMGVSHVSVINRIKQFASKFKNIPKKCEKVDILELDEMCVSVYGFGLL